MHWSISRKMQRHMSILQNRFKPKCSSTSLCITFETLELHELQCSFKVNYIKTTSTHCSVMGNYIKTTLDQCSFIGNYINTKPNQCSSMGNCIKTTSHHISVKCHHRLWYLSWNIISCGSTSIFPESRKFKNHITYHVSWNIIFYDKYHEFTKK